MTDPRAMIDVRVQAADFDPGRQIARLAERKKRAVAVFCGLVEAEGEVVETFVDHYPPLAKAELARIAGEAAARWGLEGIVLIHRHGTLRPGERLLFAGTAAADPALAQTACTWLTEQMRGEMPFWRKDLKGDGSGAWRS